MTDNAGKVISTAKSQVGYQEGRTNGHWDNVEKFAAQVPGLAWVSSDHEPWCAVFVSWVVMTAGADQYYPRTASTDAGADWFKAKGQWNQYPAVGAQVFYGVNGDMNHTGLVYDYDDTYIYTVEGNTNTNGSVEGDGVYLKKRVRRAANVQGYGYPAFPEGLKSADPSHAQPVTKPKPKPTYVETLGKNVKPSKFDKTTTDLQRALLVTGFATFKNVNKLGYYGSGTEASVTRFYDKYPQFSSGPKDTAIGPHGWAFLRSLALKS